MAENLKEVIARLKAQNSPQSQQAVKPVEKVAPAPIPVEDDEEFIDEETAQETAQEVEAVKQAEEKAVEIKVNPKNTENTEDQQKIMQQRAILQQIEALQNNGVFRMELLGQMDEIKRALMIIAKVLVDLTDDKQKS